jgi:glycosyltransferase involved in cell wall biosynthesis
MISVVIITLNEEKNIRKCLESVKWANEIIIVDSGSLDKTLEIAKEYTNKIYNIKWQGFSHAKNFGIEKCLSPWILSIDADEIITKELKEEILSSIKNNSADAFYMPRILYFCNKPVKFGGCYPDKQIRLFKKEKGKFNDVPVHEKIILEKNSIVKNLKNDLLHYSYNSISDYFVRFNRYTSLDAEKKKNKGDKFHFFDILIFPWELFRRLILKLGILDGIPGIFYHIFSAMSSLVKYAKLWEKNKEI